MATRYFVAGIGGTNNWSTTGGGSNWSASDGGAGGQTPPGSTDDVVLTSNSPSLVIDLSGRQCQSLTCIAYTGQITFTNGLVIQGNITLCLGMSLAGPNGISIQSNDATLTSGGLIVNVPLTINSSVTHTLADDWTVSGLVSMLSTSVQMVVNGHQINCLGGFRAGMTVGSVTGTTEIVLAATQTVSQPSVTNGYVGLPITVNAPGGTITFSGVQHFDLSKLTYIAGTVVTANSWPSASGLLMQQGFTGGLPA